MQRARRTKCPQGKCTRDLSHDLEAPLAGIIQGAQYLANFDTLQPALVKRI
jgi:hypothetical protein